MELDQGQAANAGALLQRAAKSPATAVPGPLLLARLLEAQRALDLPAQRSAAVALLETNAGSPAAPLAAETLQRLAGQSLLLDDQLLHDLQRLLSPPGGGGPAADLETRHRLRDAWVGLLVARGTYEQAQALRTEGGVLQDWQIVGPLSQFRYLDFDRPLGPERDPGAAQYPTPWSTPARWRPLRMNNGQLPLGQALDFEDGEDHGHPPTGDVVYLKTVVTAAGGGLWLRVESSASVAVFLDGRKILERDLFRRLRPRVEWLAVDAADGTHTLMIKAVAGEANHGLRLEALPRQAGSSPPGEAAQLPAALGGWLGLGVEVPAVRGLAAMALGDVAPHAALAALAGGPLGTFSLSARADLWPLLGTLADDDARGRTQRDLELWLARDATSPAARLRHAQLLMDLGRNPAAAADLTAALPGGEGPLQLLVARARLLLSRDASALARAPLVRALQSDPGSCSALELALSLADQANAVAEGDQLASRAERCPGGQQTLAQRRSRREGPAPLVAYWRGRLARSPADSEAAGQLADALVAQGDFPGAQQALETRRRSWPDDRAALRRQATLDDLQGRASGAPQPSPRWQMLLQAVPADLQLRRALALLAHQPTPLEDLVPAVDAALAAPRWLGTGRAPSATLLDSGAAEFYGDGTVVERVRTLEIPLDENALQPLGELELPPGALLLAMRTHKRDGRVLDADSQVAGEKHTVSAANLQVGDLLELDYLSASSPARRGQGATAEAFYFAASDSALARSVYTVRADGPMRIDAHRFAVPDLDGSPQPGTPVRLERRHVEAIAEEPDSPPQNEYFPWVQVGSGRGTTADELAASVADQLADKLTADEGLAALLAAPLEGGSGDRQRAEALWTKLNSALRAEGGTLSEAASEVIGQGAGNLVLPMLAGLRVLGVPAHLVLASGPAQPQEPHRFARLSEFGDVLLRLEPRDGPPVYLAAALRDAPFGEIPPNLCGARALLLPNAGEATPPTSEAGFRLPTCAAQAQLPGPNEHHLDIQLQIDAQGSASGSAQETLEGFEAVSLRSSLEQMDDPQRRQGVESALASVFQGAELTEVGFALGKGPGAPLKVSYRFRAAHLARAEGDRNFSLALAGFPARLSDRFAQLAGRHLPLAITAGEQPVLDLTVVLPAGAVLSKGAPAPLSLQNGFGSYLRQQSRSGLTLRVHEKLVLPAQRVAPADYPQFAAFAGRVDGAQAERVQYRIGPDSRLPAGR